MSEKTESGEDQDPAPLKHTDAERVTGEEKPTNKDTDEQKTSSSSAQSS